MKLKLRIKKDLKRELKAAAIKNEMERKDLAIQCMEAFVDENKEVWINDIEEFVSRLIENPKKLEAEILEINDNESFNSDEKSDLIREVKEKYKVIRYESRVAKKKTETLIINLEEQVYYGLLFISESNKMSIEQMAIKILTEYIKKLEQKW